MLSEHLLPHHKLVSIKLSGFIKIYIYIYFDIYTTMDFFLRSWRVHKGVEKELGGSGSVEWL